MPVEYCYAIRTLDTSEKKSDQNNSIRKSSVLSHGDVKLIP